LVLKSGCLLLVLELRYWKLYVRWCWYEDVGRIIFVDGVGIKIWNLVVCWWWYEDVDRILFVEGVGMKMLEEHCLLCWY
jgi:hypothetical protein